MGFQPAVDSYQIFLGGRWNHRREVVAWSAGAELVVRVRVRSTATEEKYNNASPREAREQYEGSGTRTRWRSYRPFSAVEGRDDITSIKILKPTESSNHLDNDLDVMDQIIIGTANGDLQLLQIPVDESGSIKTYFVTDGVPVRSTSLSPTVEGDANSGKLLAANLSDSKLALYRVDPHESKVAPVSEIDAIPHRRKGCRIWSTRFLDPKRLVVGLGPSVEPINIFEIRPEGIVREPIRKISLSGDVVSLEPVTASSIYPIEALVDANGGTGGGYTFMSGGYDGVIRLHDLRSPSSHETTYRDPTDDAAVYSLLSRGRDRVIAGTSRHCLLKVFDLRMSGSSQYDYVEAAADPHEASSNGDWNIFINPRDKYASSSWRGPNSWMRRSAEGSVYSLSSPSPNSPFIYAGVENAVVEFNFSSMRDRHPDPIFSAPLKNAIIRREQPSAYFKNKQDVLNLAMYSQGSHGAKQAMKLRLQRGVGDLSDQEIALAGLDERWRENH